jgi:hypothetical protein
MSEQIQKWDQERLNQLNSTPLDTEVSETDRSVMNKVTQKVIKDPPSKQLLSDIKTFYDKLKIHVHDVEQSKELKDELKMRIMTIYKQFLPVFQNILDNHNYKLKYTAPLQEFIKRMS